MKRIALFLFTLISATSLNAVQYKNALEEPPPSDSPVGVYLLFQKAAAKEDLPAMRSFSTGHILSMLENKEAAERYTSKAKDIDWSKPIMWAHKIDGESAKIGVRYKRISDGRTFNVKLYCRQVDGKWKFSGTKD